MMDDVAQLVTRAALEAPGRVAVVDEDGRSLTWVQLEDEVDRIATGLAQAGVLGGHRVLLALGNRMELVTAYLGVLRAQAVAVPVNPRSTATELARMVVDSGARMVLADEDSIRAARDGLRTVEAALAGVAGAMDLFDADLHDRVPTRTDLVVLDGPPEDGETAFATLRAEEPRPVPPLQDPDKLAVLLYTSGVTGLPRAALLTHRALLANIDQVARVEPPMIHADDVILGVLPLFHVYGLNAVLGGALRHAATLVVQRRFDPVGTLDLVVEHRCTMLPVAPAVFRPWLALPDLRERLAGVRLVLSGSAPLPREVVEQFEAATGLTVHQGYGLTEAAPVVTSTLCSGVAKPGSVGAVLEGMEVSLVDERGMPVSGEDPGEIRLRGPNLFKGYWPDGGGGPDADGWWATGDVGFLDEDGDLFLVDRLKELVIVSGFNVYPHEVEDVIRSLPEVHEAAVIGVPDDDTGEAVVAYVVTPGLDEATAQELVAEACAARLARFKQPARIEVVETLPLSVTGKVQKGRLRGIERRRALELLGEQR
jgi:long-chain acyl-CoA synthetase